MQLKMALQFIPMLLLLTQMLLLISASNNANTNTNEVYQPCADSEIQRFDGFTFAIAFSSKDSFFLNHNRSLFQLSPCDRRLSLHRSSHSHLALFRPKVDQISLLTINTTSVFFPGNYGGYMVAFAGRKYAARSTPAFVANSTYIVTSFTLVLEFQKGRLQNLYWKRDECASCKEKTSNNFICLNKQDCAIKKSFCKGHGGSVDCSLGIQLAFSGTDKHLSVLNSWYEVENLRQYSLYALYSNLRDSLTTQYNKLV